MRGGRVNEWRRQELAAGGNVADQSTVKSSDEWRL
jgi:hypothetical protein